MDSGRVSHSVQDLKYGLRRLAQNPGFTAVAVLSLAIGIGANTAIFSVLNAVLIRDRPYTAPEELVHIYSNIENESDCANSSYQDLLDLEALNDVFAGVGAFAGRMSRVRENDEIRHVMIEAVTQNLFPLLGIQAAVGRTFLPEEDVVPGAHNVAILGHSYWQRRHGSDPGVLGRTIELAGSLYTIVGVAPERLESLFMPGVRTDVFVPLMMAASLSGDQDGGTFTDRDALDIKIIGRLQETVGLDQARTRVDILSRQLQATYPAAYEGRSFNLVPTLDVVIQPDFDAILLMPVATLMMTMVGLVLLLTCTNLAGFLLTQGIERKKEIAIRLALGAQRRRLVSQLLTETLILGAMGGAAGLLLARWTLDLLSSLQPQFWISIEIDHRLDGTVLLFTLGVAMLAGVLAGLAPAIRSTNPDVTPTLKDEAMTGRRGGLGVRNGLVAFQIAISTVLLVGGGLFLRSLQEAGTADPGFSTREAGMIWMDLGLSGVPEEERITLAEEIATRARSLPGLDAVGYSSGVPLVLGIWQSDYTIPGVEPPEGREGHRVPRYTIDPDFFDAMGITLVGGRGIMTRDRQGSENVVVVSEAAARRFWLDESPLGNMIYAVENDDAYRVIGIARDVKIRSLGAPAEPVFYFAEAQSELRNLWLIARGQTSAPEIAAALRRVVREVRKELVIMSETTLEEQLAVKLFPIRVAAGMLAVFGLLALVLAAIGLYGVVSFSVSRRTREVGIRMSLGANGRALTWVMARGAIGVVVMGALIGVGTAFGMAQLLRHFLIGVAPGDPVTLVSVPLLLCGIATLAALVPSRRACRVSPVTALRCE
jgi:predicted permease